jgi:hypothetical protein
LNAYKAPNLTRKLSRGRKGSSNNTLAEPEAAELAVTEVDNSVKVFDMKFVADYDLGALQLSIWDLGGQPIFHQFLQLQLQGKPIYTHVFNMCAMSSQATDLERQRVIRGFIYWQGLVERLTKDAHIVFVGTIQCF